VKYRVEVPYRTEYAMPTTCVACGAPAPHLTWEVKHFGLSVGGGVVGGEVATHTAAIAFPVCGPCHQAVNVETTDATKGCLPSVLLGGAATIGLFLVRASLPATWWAFLGGGLALVAAWAVLRATRHDKPAPEVVERGRRVEAAVKIREVDDHGTPFHHRHKHVTFDFRREDAARQFALANDGTLTPR
jgi:hypothetical protein